MNIKDIKFETWPDLFLSLGLKKYAWRQVYQWLFKKGAASFDEMTNLSKDARRILSENFYISRLKISDILEDKDGTKKYCFELSDGNRIESVLIPEISVGAASARRLENVKAVGRSGVSAAMSPRGGGSYKCRGGALSPPLNDRLTLCISSQVGCALDCVFCRTAKMGFVRNLTASEIVDQVLEVSRSLRGSRRLQPALITHPEGCGYRDDMQITNIVLMGMGEPLYNYENVKRAIEILKDENGMAIAKRKITLSTAGIVPGIKKMTKDKLGVKLAISLNATTDEIRQRIMPIAKKYSIEDIIGACRGYAPPNGRMRTTFEYVMIDGINDSIEDAGRLTALMSQLPSKVNLIPLNPYPGCPFKKPKEKVLNQFYNYLYNKHIQVNIRKGRGTDILAACGQLAGVG